MRHPRRQLIISVLALGLAVASRASADETAVFQRSSVRLLTHAARKEIDASTTWVRREFDDLAAEEGRCVSEGVLRCVEEPPTPAPAHRVAVTPVERGGAPWQAQIFQAVDTSVLDNYRRAFPAERDVPDWELEHVCGGALVAPNWVMTAAHCLLPPYHDNAAPVFTDLNAFEKRRQVLGVSRERGVPLATCVKARLVAPTFRVRLGAYDLSRNEGATYPIDCVVLHPDWKRSDMYHADIALVHYAMPPAPTGAHADAAPIVLDRGADLAPRQRVAAFGWGKTEPVEGIDPSAVLNRVDLAIEPRAACAQALGVAQDQVDLRVLCAGSDVAKTCLGDSGGPVVIMDAVRRAALVGIVSWGNDDCEADHKPGVYTRVSEYATWFDDVTNARRQ